MNYEQAHHLAMQQIEGVTDLHVMRGKYPWSLYGCAGNVRQEWIERRDRLVARIHDALEPHGWSAQLVKMSGKTQLTLADGKGNETVWAWSI